MIALMASTPLQLLTVLVSAVVSYVLLLVLVRCSRGRLVTRLSAADAVLLLVLGAVIGRGILGISPTLVAALVGGGALVGLRVALALVTRSPRGRRLVEPSPLLLIGGGQIIPSHLRRAHVRRDELFGALRRAGVAGVEEVACAVLEIDGLISVTRLDPNRPLERQLFLGVQCTERVPDDLFGNG